MSVVIDTPSFIKGLTAARTMAYAGSSEDPTFAACVLATARVETGEVGTQNSLVFLGSDGNSPGQVIYPADGSINTVKFSTSQASQLIAAAKGASSAAKKSDKEAECSVELSIVEEGSTLLMRTLTDGFPGDDDSRHYIPLQDLTKFPLGSTLTRLTARGVKEILGTRGTGDEQTTAPLKTGALQSFAGSTLKKMAAIEAVFKEPIEIYTREHPASVVTITCAGVFRAVLHAHVYSPDIDVDDPEVPVAVDLAAGAQKDQQVAETGAGTAA